MRNKTVHEELAKHLIFYLRLGADPTMIANILQVKTRHRPSVEMDYFMFIRNIFLIYLYIYFLFLAFVVLFWHHGEKHGTLSYGQRPKSQSKSSMPRPIVGNKVFSLLQFFTRNLYDWIGKSFYSLQWLNRLSKPNINVPCRVLLSSIIEAKQIGKVLAGLYASLNIIGSPFFLW